MAEDERRRAPRFEARIVVKFRSVEELVTAYSTDISHGGLFVAAAQQLDVGARVLLHLELPDGGKPARVPAEVAYVVGAATAAVEGRNPGMGMKFVESSVAPLATRIAHFLDATSRPPEAPEAAEPGGPHVLVVDDSASYRAGVARCLEKAGLRVSTAEHGLDALGKAMRDRPDVVLTDVQMPVMDGWQLLRIVRAREATSKVPVVFLTTLDGESDRIRGYQLGVDDYIPKPFVPEELVARVRRTVRRSVRDEHIDDGMSGSLEQVSLPSLLAFAEAERRSGQLVVDGPVGDARVALAEGAVVSVELSEGGPASLLERLLGLLDWTEGRFSLTTCEVEAGAERVSVQGALLEHARRRDERGAR
ncbi:MAG: response regulator [Sandaracinaceae bacterium]